MTAPSLPTALRDLLNHEMPLDVAIDRHFASDYRQCTNGSWDDRDAFREHIAHLRTVIASADISMVNEMRSSDRYAEQHIARMVKFDGSVVTQEVFLFADVDADGRFVRLEEVTNMLDGAEADRGIGNAR